MFFLTPDMESSTLWFLLGFVLVLLEFAVPGVILVFFGLGAWVTCVAVKLGWAESLAAQMVVFWVSSVVLLFALRNLFQAWFRGFSSTRDTSVNLDDYAGQEVVVLEAVMIGSRGRVEFKGAPWAARAEEELLAGERAVITGMDGLCLLIRKK
jgi:membrane protein implicated in regulation of membrane protease activity